MRRKERIKNLLDKTPVSDVKFLLDHYLPGFTDACEKALEVGPKSCVVLRQCDFDDNNEDRALMGAAIQYAISVGVVNVIFSSRSPKEVKLNRAPLNFLDKDLVVV